MPWISYARNGEDVRLRRAFADHSNGFYVDVGASDPVEFSVTKHFYDAGWSGINVEPLPKQFALLRAARERDINLNLSCSNSPSVETTTLAEVLRNHAANRQIDFLSIGVEGHEREVLEGADFVRFRPRVVLVEATRPLAHERWEQPLLRSGYVFVVFDGLNRFYVRREDEHLAPKLALAPNVFDDSIPHLYQRRIDELEERLAAAKKADDLLVRSVARVFQGAGKLARRSRRG